MVTPDNPIARSAPPDSPLGKLLMLSPTGDYTIIASNEGLADVEDLLTHLPPNRRLAIMTTLQRYGERVQSVRANVLQTSMLGKKGFLQAAQMNPDLHELIARQISLVYPGEAFKIRLMSRPGQGLVEIPIPEQPTARDLLNPNYALVRKSSKPDPYMNMLLAYNLIVPSLDHLEKDDPIKTIDELEGYSSSVGLKFEPRYLHLLGFTPLASLNVIGMLKETHALNPSNIDQYYSSVADWMTMLSAFRLKHHPDGHENVMPLPYKKLVNSRGDKTLGQLTMYSALDETQESFPIEFMPYLYRAFLHYFLELPLLENTDHVLSVNGIFEELDNFNEHLKQFYNDQLKPNHSNADIDGRITRAKRVIQPMRVAFRGLRQVLNDNSKMLRTGVGMGNPEITDDYLELRDQIYQEDFGLKPSQWANKRLTIAA